MAPTTESKLNMEALSKQEVLQLFCVLEGELEARDLVIHMLRSQRRDVYVRERYGKYDLSDPFLALQRDGEVLRGTSADSPASTGHPSNPVSILRLVISQCRRMQERMMRQLAAAESRHRRVIADLEEEKRKHAEDTAEGDDVTYILEKERERLLQQLEFERVQVQFTEREKRRLQDQLEKEKVQHKQLSAALSRECKRTAIHAHEEAQRANQLSRQLDRERSTNHSLKAELEAERRRSMLMEARREEQLAEFDTEREQLILQLKREETRSGELQKEVEMLRRELKDLKGGTGAEERRVNSTQPNSGSICAREQKPLIQPKINGHHILDTGPAESLNGNESRSTVLPTPSERTPTITPMSSPSPANPSANGLSPCPSPVLPHRQNDSLSLQASYQAAINQRFHATRHRFQANLESEACGTAGPTLHSPRDLSPCIMTLPDHSQSREPACSSVPQALNRVSSGSGPAKQLPPSSSSPIGSDHHSSAHSGICSPTIPRSERGIPPPIPPKKPGLANAPPSPAILRAAHFLSAGCGRISTSDSTKELDMVVSSTG
ncbi:CTTNBP2 N-terminal-like protein [Chanos chanos]|uniref:CTTNBP2 N-terminal-like protein n=1 Tax=Chanos chanos TaxID=29144 RepID=A0A6J2VM48_CHACN|nr:CTTNBP2 N-terminal-like protein [Chanos chanos]